MTDLADFLLARYDEIQRAAEAVPPLEHNYDMGGNRQDERFTFGRTLPSSADGMGNWSPHRDSPTTAEHFARHDPAYVLADVEAKRRIVERCAAVDYAMPSTHLAHGTLRALAQPFADHPEFQEAWKI